MRRIPRSPAITRRRSAYSTLCTATYFLARMEAITTWNRNMHVWPTAQTRLSIPRVTRNMSISGNGRFAKNWRTSRRKHGSPPAALLINQIFFPHLQKLLQPLLPILRDPPRILARDQCVIDTLIHQQLGHALDLEIRR